MSEPYDSTADTRAHIERVAELILDGCDNLEGRAARHDQSKLQSPEKDAFDILTPRLKGLTYGSDEYRACLRELKPALDHHYAANAHHPEHWANGVDDMSLFDVVEMACDWAAAVERHEDGDLRTSVEINRARFALSDQLAGILLNTYREMGLIPTPDAGEG